MWSYLLTLKLTLGIIIFQCALNTVEWQSSILQNKRLPVHKCQKIKTSNRDWSRGKAASCYTCDRVNCKNPKAKMCSMRRDKCFIWFDVKNNVSEMGCVSSLGPGSFEQFLKTKRVTFCDSDNCNLLQIPVPQRCIVSNSTIDFNCANNPATIGTFNTCNKLPYTHCYARLSADGNMERGCLSDLPTNQFLDCILGVDMNCGLCLGEGCEGEIFKKNDYDVYKGYWQSLPLRCYNCVGKKGCAGSKDAAPLCRGSIKQDCMTVFNADGVVVRRGCEHNVENEYAEWCNAHKDFCFKCKSNECNVNVPHSFLKQCVFCLSSKDPYCATRPNRVFSKTKCITDCMVAMRDGEVIRSCLDDMDTRDHYKCLGDRKYCKVCSGSNCNTFVFPKDRMSCHVCTNSSCCSSEPEYCAKYDKNDACFAKYENGKIDLMGCVSGQNVTDIKKWRAEKRLYECDFNNCNNFNQRESEKDEL